MANPDAVAVNQFSSVQQRQISAVEHSGELGVSTILVRGRVEVICQRVRAKDNVTLSVLDGLCNEPRERTFPLSELRLLLADAVQKTGEPALGLLWGKHATAASFGMMTPLVSYALTLRQALATVSQFSSLMIDGAQFQLRENMDIAQLRCDLPPGMNTADRTLVEMMQAGLVRLLEEFGCTRSDIRAVAFEYARPVYYHAYATAFAGAERFSQPYTGIELAVEALDRRHMHHDSELQALITAQAERSLERRAQPRSYAEQVVSLLGTSRPGEVPEMRDIARRLRIGERSLRRRLEEEGTTYRVLCQSHLYKVACSMLRNPDLTLQGVASALGFSDATAFNRAFRRWSDLTPAEYRSSRLTNSGSFGPEAPNAQLHYGS